MSVRALPTYLIAAFVLFAVQFDAAVAQTSPFKDMGGSWRGAGSLTLTNGKKERLRCRAYYTPRANGSRMGMALRCASPSIRLELRSQLTFRNGLVSGSWNETTYNTEGSIRGRATRNRLNLRISGSVSGALRVSITGNRQNVSFNTTGGQLRGVNISLSRG